VVVVRPCARAGGAGGSPKSPNDPLLPALMNPNEVPSPRASGGGGSIPNSALDPSSSGPGIGGSWLYEVTSSGSWNSNMDPVLACSGGAGSFGSGWSGLGLFGSVGFDMVLLRAGGRPRAACAYLRHVNRPRRPPRRWRRIFPAVLPPSRPDRRNRRQLPDLAQPVRPEERAQASGGREPPECSAPSVAGRTLGGLTPPLASTEPTSRTRRSGRRSRTSRARARV
jgi:hypothetical protein